MAFKLQLAANRLPLILPKPFFPAASTTPNFRAKKFYGAMAYDEAGGAAKDAARKGGQQLKKEAATAMNSAGDKIEDISRKVAGNAQDATVKSKRMAADATEKVKETAQDAWETVKDTAQNIKDTVVGKAEAAADSAKNATGETKRTIQSQK